MNLPIIAPSLLASDFSQLGNEIAWINQSEADWIHFDVMDGMFVPNISFGIPVLKSIRPLTEKKIDVHLMIEDPIRFIEVFQQAGANVCTVHFEACQHLDRVLHKIKECGMKAGVALNPASPVSVLQHVLGIVDLVLIMSVNPGYGGQKFIPYTYDKIRELAAMKEKLGLSFHIEIDGGVNPGNAAALFQAGASVLVAGNSVFSSTDPSKTVSSLKHCLQK